MIVEPAQVSVAIERHRAHPDISIEAHVEHVRQTLGRSLSTRRPIYLDTKYWIFLRDAALGIPQKKVHSDLLETARAGIQSGVWFFPLSDTTFLEIIHIGNTHRRLATAALAQELSLGATICPEHERIDLELTNLMRTQAPIRAALRPHIWLKLSSVLGAVTIKDSRLLPDDAIAVSKAFFDYQWEMTLTQLLETVGENIADFPYARIAKNVDASNRLHADEVGTFKTTYLNEIAGLLDLFKRQAAQVVEDMYRATGLQYEPTSDQMAKADSDVLKLLLAIAGAGKGATSFPTLHVLAKLHAGFRRDKKRVLDRNTLPDFHHAAAALVYCHAFLTERPLKDLIRSGTVGLDKEFDCVVHADEQQALDCLSHMLNGA